MTTFYIIKKSTRIVKPYVRTRKGKLEHVGGYTAEMTEAERMKLERKREAAREWIRRHRERMKSLKGEMDKVKEREKEISLEEAAIESKKYIGAKEIRNLESKRSEIPKRSTKEYYEKVLEVKKDYIESKIDSVIARDRLLECGIGLGDTHDLLKKWEEELATGASFVEMGKEKEIPKWMETLVKPSPEDTKRKSELKAEKVELDKEKKAIEEKAKVEAEGASFIRMATAKTKKVAKEVLGPETDLVIGGKIGTVRGYKAHLPGMEEFPEVESLGILWIWKNEKTGFWDARNAETREWLVKSEDKILTAEECYDRAYTKTKEIMGPRLAVAKERPIYEGLFLITGEKFVDKETGKFITITRSAADGIELIYVDTGTRKVVRPSEFAGKYERVPDIDTVKLDHAKKFGGLKAGDMLWESYSKWGLVSSVGDMIEILFNGDLEPRKVTKEQFASDYIKVWGYKKADPPPPKPSILKKDQKDALEYQGRGNEVTDDHIARTAKDFDYPEETVRKVIEAVRNIPLKVNRWFIPGGRSFPDTYANCKLKNQFQLREYATSSGSLDPHKDGCRDSWERTITGGALHRSSGYKALGGGKYLPEEIAELRPIYGHWDYAKDAADGYGHIQLLMKEEVKTRTGFTIGNSSALYTDLSDGAGTFKSPMALVRNIFRYNKSSIDTIIKTGVAEASSGVYIEAQIYGGVDLRRDVAKIIIKKSSRRSVGGTTHIEAMAKKYKIPFEYE